MFQLSRLRNTVFELSRKQIKTQYRNSALGFVWSFLNPLLNMLVMWLVFSSFFGRGDPYYPLYLLVGNLLFSTLRNSTMQCLDSLVTNRGLLLKTRIKFFVFPLSNILASVVNFGLSFIALLPFMIWLSISQGINLFSYQLPFLLLMLPAYFLFEFGIGLILSSCYVFFRDLKHIYGIFLTLWTYLTPIFYKTADIASKSKVVYQIICLNPMFHFLNYFRDCVYRGASGIDMNGNNIGAFIPYWKTLGICYLCALIFMVIGFIVFGLLKKKIIMRV